MLVRDVMTAAPACCNPTETVESAAILMLDHDCGAVPVCDGMSVVGIVTDRDIACKCAARGRAPKTMKVRELMTRNVTTVRDTAVVEDAVALMEAQRVRRLPVVDRDDHITGIVAIADLVQELEPARAARLLGSVSEKGKVALAIAAQ